MSESYNPNDWIFDAVCEIKYAERNFDSTYDETEYRYIAYNVQQAAEKAVKAVILKQQRVDSIEEIMSHDIPELLEKIDKEECPYDDIFIKYGYMMTPYCVKTRYPTERVIDRDELKYAIKFSKKICNWAVDVINNYVVRYKRIFPDYDGEIVIPKGFRDTSDKEDGIPSVSRITDEHEIKIFFDYENVDKKHSTFMRGKKYALFIDGIFTMSHNSMDKIIHCTKKHLSRV